MTESTSAVEQAVQARIAAARIKVQAAKEQRASLAAARRVGLARRHANKLRRLVDAERQDQDPNSASRMETLMPTIPNAVLITLDGNTIPLTLPDTPEDRLTVMKAVICCHDVEAADLSDRWAVWVDEYGGMLGHHRRPLNVVASALADNHGVTGGIRGPALITGRSEKGTCPLDEDGVAAVVAAVEELVHVEWVPTS